MRFFQAPPALFDALRASVIEQLSMPNQWADEPWAAGISSLALGPHHYEPDQYAAMVSNALQMGVQEITEAEYRALQPISQEL